MGQVRVDQKVAGVTDRVQETNTAPAKPRRRRTFARVLLWTSSIVLLVLVGFAIAGDIMLHRAGPMLKSMVIETLSTRFDSRVELDGFHVSMVRGFEVYGSGLKLYPNHLDMTEPMIEVGGFSFHAMDWRQLLKTPLYINHVQVSNLNIHLPPKEQRRNLARPANSQAPGVDESHGKIKILIGEIAIDHADLLIENGKPGKVPLNFVIDRLTLKSVGAGQPMRFHATLVNPRPIGNIDSAGDFGPFNAESPGDTAVSGQYTFRNADLNTIKGIGGMLSSDGSYSGQLDHIVVDGETKTPNFSLDIANRPVPLNTKFHAIVDGTNGDTYLQPVDAWLRQTHIVARGEVAHTAGIPGKHIRLDVSIDPGRIQDLLELAVKTQPPLINGQVRLHMKFDLPPGPATVTSKLHLQGNFDIEGAHFTSEKIQSKVDELSLRGQGKPADANREDAALKNGNAQDPSVANVASEMRGEFAFGSNKLSISDLNFLVPGAKIQLSGDYTLDGQIFDFTGTARLDAHVSQMVTGWKSLLLKPVDPFFAKDGAGTLVPIKVSGTRSEPQVGLNFKH